MADFRRLPCPFPSATIPSQTVFPAAPPALHGRKLCFYHQRDDKRHARAAKVVRQLDVVGPRLPRIRNLQQVQQATYEILQAIADRRIDIDRVGLHLFEIQWIMARFARRCN